MLPILVFAYPSIPQLLKSSRFSWFVSTLLCIPELLCKAYALGPLLFQIRISGWLRPVGNVPTLFLGDFSVCIDSSFGLTTPWLLSVTTTSDLGTNSPTHCHGHFLDLVFTKKQWHVG